VRLVQVVPGWRPLVCGTGEYALAVARALRSQERLESRFVVLNAGWRGGPEVEGFGAQAAAFCAEGLIPLLQDDAEDDAVVVLHYENYGYATRGLPFWLVRSLSRWKATRPRRRLVTVFHALFASGLPWRSSFWLSPIQKQLSARLRRLSDAAVALGAEDAARLTRWHPQGRERLASLSVTSTVGEPADPAPLAVRAPRMVVFGREATRARAYGPQRRELARACRALGIEEILDIGPWLALPRLDGISVRALGPLPAGEVSAAMAGSLAGFFSYPNQDLVKSSVLACYLAHGALAVTGGRYRRCEDGPVAGLHYWLVQAGAAAPDTEQRQRLASSGLAWYRAHGHSAVATPAYARLLREACA
jgi:hypothetical protein